ncbi:MAG: diguanylate cyclase [Deltaproteobacteria bacterium]
MEALKFSMNEIENIKEECTQAQAKLQHHLEFEKLITGLATDFINIPISDIDKGINQALKSIAEFAGADLSYIFLLCDNLTKMNIIYCWSAEGVEELRMQEWQGLSVDALEWGSRKLKNHEVVHIPRVEDLPAEAAAEKELCLKHSLKSLLIVPMVYNGSLIGFLGFSSLRGEKYFPDEDIALLRIGAEVFVNIIERRQAEEALRENEETSRLFLQNFQGIAFKSVISFRKLLFLSGAVTKMTGYNEEEFLSGAVKWKQIIHPDDLAKVQETIDKIHVVPDYSTEREYRIIRKDGQVRWVYELIKNICDDSGKPAMVQGAIYDVTERKMAEERLVKINECFLNFNYDAVHNINLITALCGQLLGGFCAFYNRLDNGMLHSWGHWNAPANCKLVDSPEGHICYDVIRQASDEVFVINNPAPAQSEGAGSEGELEFKTYVGRGVKLSDKYVGSLCVLYDKDFIPGDEDKRIMELMARAIASEESRKNIEESLRTSEERYRTLAESAQDLIFIIDSEWQTRYINLFGAQLVGRRPEEIMDKPFGEIFSPDISKFLQKDLSRVFESAQAVSVENKIKLGDRDLWLDTKLIPIKDASGNVSAVMSIARDITERKYVADALEERERFLSSIFSSIQDGVSVLDTDLNIIRVNSTMEKWYSHAMPLVGKKCYEAYHGRHTVCPSCPSVRTLESAQPSYEVVPKAGPGGKTVGWLDLYSFPLIDTLTGKMQGIIEYVRDITERKKAEEERIALNKELLKSNERLKQLALRDSHTGLYNHRYLQEIIEAEFYRTRRYAQSLSVMMLDIDYFKSINDVYGHNFGDVVLKQFSKILKKMVRRYDTVIRYGGEEFIVICSGTDRANALSLARRILDAINLFDFGNRKHSVKLKLSIAVAAYPEDKIVKGMDLVELADQILNRAKEFGGNRVYSSLDIKKKARPGAEISDRIGSVKFLKEKIDKLNKRANQSLVEAIFAFARTIEVKDHYTGEHVEKTVKYATEIAKYLNLPEHDIELIRRAAMLHDLGKIGISENILRKKGKLTRKEFAEIKKHPQIGVEIIRPIQFLHPIIPILLYHHERWDGRGYPSGLKGEDIPIGARVVAIADVYQALISDRPYRKAYAENKAIEIIREGSGKLFDPQIVDAFLKVIHKIQ